MDEGYKNWPIVRKMLIDNRMEHAALLAYSINVPEALFVMRARSAYRRIESRVDDSVEIANDTLGRVADAMAREADLATNPPANETKPAEEGVAANVCRVDEDKPADPEAK